ncbi:unnamed protein product [Closterium sp. NIES-53]
MFLASLFFILLNPSLPARSLHSSPFFIPPASSPFFPLFPLRPPSFSFSPPFSGHAHVPLLPHRRLTSLFRHRCSLPPFLFPLYPSPLFLFHQGTLTFLSALTAGYLPSSTIAAAFLLAPVTSLAHLSSPIAHEAAKLDLDRITLTLYPSLSPLFPPRAAIAHSILSEATAGAEEYSEVEEVQWAVRVVRHWQEVKAAALGPQHRVDRLGEILEGPMLELWRNRAKEVENNGWFWEYSFLSLNVEMAAVSKGEKKAVVEAVVQEAARLVDAADPTHNDAYRSTYTARYELLQTGTCWKIVGGTVLR